jgi:hypothetical protein
MFALRSPAMRFFQALPTFIVVTAHATAPGPASAQPPTRLHTPGQRVNCISPAGSGVWSSFPPSPARSCTASRDAGETSWPGAGYKRREVLRLPDAAPNLTWMTTHLAAQRRLASSVGGVSEQQVGSRARLHTALGYA